MWTLINAKKTICRGVFPTYDIAIKWAESFRLKLEPIEVLVNTDESTPLSTVPTPLFIQLTSAVSQPSLSIN